MLLIAPTGLVESIDHALRNAGVEIGAVGLAWARVMPTLVLVPAFGLKALPLPVRGALGFMLALVIFPGVDAPGHADAMVQMSWPAALLFEVLRGLPPAIAASVPLWAATMTGGLADQLRGSSESVHSPVVFGQTTIMGNIFSMLASALFLSSGGASRVAFALVRPATQAGVLLRTAESLTTGIDIAIAIGTPLLATSLVIEIGAALITRAASPAQIQALTSPLKAFGILFVLAFSLKSMAWILLNYMQ